MLSAEMWAQIERLLPCSDGRRERPFRDRRQVTEGIIYRLRTGVPWRDLPAEFGPWQTVWARHARYSADGTWDRVLTAVPAVADASGELDWTVPVDSTIARVHQHGATAARSASSVPAHAGGAAELQESA